MELFHSFQQHWKQHFAQRIPANVHFMLAVSGGVDSVVLVDLFAKATLPFTILHVNFHLRAEESDRDEQFVRSIGEKYKISTLVKEADAKQFSIDHKCSIQEAARKIRYDWFQEMLLQKNNESISTYLVTAHHGDDNIETMMMHFFRGTGIQGISGIQPYHADRKLLRPLLTFRKAELLSYATKNGLSFVEDSSNASDKYTRNFFRNQLIPEIKEVYPQVEENLLENAIRFNEIGILYHQSVKTHLKKLITQKGDEFHVPVMLWQKVEPLHTITWEIIKLFGFHASQVYEVIKLLDAENGKYISSTTHRIIHNRNWMIITPMKENVSRHFMIESNEKEIFFQEGTLQFKTMANVQLDITSDQMQALIDLTPIQFPLLLRKWKTGDYFYPLGMQKKKKLSRFFIDQKLSLSDKEKMWVIESDKRIVWVVGLRIDDRFKIKPNTKDLLQIRYLK